MTMAVGSMYLEFTCPGFVENGKYTFFFLLLKGSCKHDIIRTAYPAPVPSRLVRIFQTDVPVGKLDKAVK